MWSHVDMNSYFASCEQQVREELRGRPIIIVPVAGTDHTSAIAASYEAKKYGVGTGTSVAEARRLCRIIEEVESRPKLYRETHFRIVEAVGAVAPVSEVLSVDEMVIGSWRNEEKLADALRLGQRIQDSIRLNVGEWMSASIGIAPSPFLAKVASDFQKPRGLSVISPDDIPGKLFHMKLTDWPGISHGMERRFHDFGVTTTEQMYAMSMKDMRHVFKSIEGERWYRAIWGEKVARPQIKRWQVGHGNVLPPEFRTDPAAYGVASRLIEKAAERLRSEELYAQRLSIDVAGYGGGRWSRSVKFTPSDMTRHFLTLLDKLWKHGGVRTPSHVGIALQDVIARADVTLNLFPEMMERNALDVALDSVNQRFGRGTLTAASSLASKDYLNHERIPFGKPTDLR